MTTPAAPATVLAFTAFWEYQCCGTPLTVGDVVEIRYTPDRTPAGEDPLTGHARPQWYVGHHDDDHASARVRVLRIDEVWVTLDYRGDRAYAARPGSARLTRIRRMRTVDPTWSPAMPEPPATHRPGEPWGWLLQLEVLERLPESDLSGGR